MSVRQTAIGVLVLTFSLSLTVSPQAPETFTATASVKSAAGATATAPITIVVDRKMTQAEADTLMAAFKGGGETALRKALEGVPQTGSVRIGGGAATPARLTLERPTDKGRLVTIVTDQPRLFIGSGVPGSKPKEGYGFGVIDLVIDGSGAGSGTISPAAKVGVKGGAFVVDDYASELVRLVDVKKVK